MVGSGKNMLETFPYKPRRRLMPARIKPHQPWISVKFERPHRPVRPRREKPKRCNHSHAEPVQPWMDGESRALGPDRILEQCVKRGLTPNDRGLIRQLRSAHMRRSEEHTSELQSRENLV